MIKTSLKQVSYTSIIIVLLFVYLGAIYFSIAAANIVLAVTLFIFVLAVLTQKIQLDFKKHNWCLYVLIIVPFLLTIVSVLYSNNTIKGLNYVWMRIPIIAVPFVIIFMEIKKDSIKNGLKIFTIFTVCASLVTVYNAIKYINEDILFITDFAFFITIIQHPYLGVFILLTLVSIVEFKLIKNKPLKLFVFILLSVTISLTTSRLVYVLFFLILGFYLFNKFSKKRALFFTLGLIIVASLFVLSNQQIKSKFQNSIQYENSPRLRLWNNSYKVITSSNSLLFGIGIGDFYENKKDPYFLKESETGIQGYNPHSQIVEFFITNGIIGLLILLMSIIFGINKIINQNRFAIIVFLIVLLFSLTESILSRQLGVQLYSVLIPLVFNKSLIKGNETS